MDIFISVINVNIKIPYNFRQIVILRMQYLLPQKLSLNYDSLLDYFLVLLTQINIFKCKVLYCKNSINYLIVFPIEIHPKKCNMLFLYTENGEPFVPFLFKIVYKFYLSYINSEFMSFAMVNNKSCKNIDAYSFSLDL